jgi:hypothetical protein
MKVKFLLGVVVLLTGLAGYVFFHASQGQSMQNLADQINNKTGSVESPEILGTTLQIEVTLPYDASGDRFVVAKGLGSLIRNGGVMFLVTHNHWGDILRGGSAVTFYDVDGDLLKTMSGSEFKTLIRYRDAGSLILQVQQEWVEQSVPGIVGDPRDVAAGDSVLVTQRDGPNRKEVILVEAEVVSVMIYEGLPVYRLNLPEGPPFQGGDSGGGVWHNGKLVGITYATVLVEPFLFKLIPSLKSGEAGLETTSFGYAARYPADRLGSILAILSGDTDTLTSTDQSLVPTPKNRFQKD